MKKLLFSALASVAFAGSGFASNEIVESSIFLNNEFSVETAEKSGLNFLGEEFAPCQVEFWVFDSDGGFVDYVHTYIDVETAGECEIFGLGVLEGYTAAFPDRVISDLEISF